MAEQVGTLLWQWRTARGWSLGQLGQRAGVSKAALSRWEAGQRQPRMPELEATLAALGATPLQRALAIACIEAPRALRHLHSSTGPSGIGAPPSAGDLLWALRQRGGWTQEQIALRLGVDQSSVGRWERGERLPSTEQMQALCFAMEAQEEEIVALTTGRFAEAPEQMPTEPQAVSDYLNPLLYDPCAELVDLRFLRLERCLWQQATKEGRTQSLLATAYAAHAHYLSLYKRWEEVRTMAQRALALTPQEGSTADYTLRAVLKLAAAEVYGGQRTAPERGFQRIKAWLPHSSEPTYTAWMLSDMGKYLMMAGQRESAVELGKKAVGIMNDEEMRHLDYCQLLVAAGYSGKALDHLPALCEQERGISVYEALLRCEAYLKLGEQSEASTWLERAYAVIEAEGLEHNRSQADALAKQF